MPPLGLGERELPDDPPRLGRIIVFDRRLEALAKRFGLAELAPQPAEEAHLCGAQSQSFRTSSRRSVTKPRRP